MKFGIRPSYRGGHVAIAENAVEMARIAEAAGCESICQGKRFVSFTRPREDCD